MSISLIPQLILFLSTIISIANTTHAYNKCIDDQKLLLLELKNDLIFNSSFSIKLVQWNQTDDCCSWEGVECDSAGHVISLQLDHEAVSGGIEKLSGHLIGLKYLQKLDLSSNSLNGGIPQSLFRLLSLQQLQLSNNLFSGQIDEFRAPNLSSITHLDLSSNHFKGPIPQSFFNLEKLRVLSLSNNFFSGTFQIENIQRLPYLTTLDLSYNNLSVDASNTSLISSGFSRLKKLSLASCNLRKIPEFIIQSNLEFLDLSNNQIAGEIPSWIWEIGNGTLYHMNLSHNLLLDLQKPYHFPSFLAEIDLHSNKLRGDLPLLPRGASYVDFSNNEFDKPVPLDFVNSISFLTFLSLANNSIIGHFPTSVCNAVFLQVLDLSLNKLSGDIPPCILESVYNLQVFDLRMNNLTGAIPDKFSADCSLKFLDFSHNSLGGHVPSSLANCKNLVFINVGHNNINDSFPCMLSSSLRILVLRSNRFHGEVRCHIIWPSLRIIDIASNNFSGDLHAISFLRWRKMMLDEDEPAVRHLRAGINVVRPDFYYKTSSGWSFKEIDFSSNNFQGELPDAIGNLSSLSYLNLSDNAFTGAIPKSLSNMRKVEALDLSVNQLTGKIPMELTGLTFLSILDLSYNKLAGAVPIGNQFQTFSNDSYEGNTGLCGVPLSNSCSNSTDEKDTSLPKHEDVVGCDVGCSNSTDEKDVSPPTLEGVIGCVVGVGSVLWLLLL